MKTFTSINKDLAAFDLINVVPVKIVNIVSDDEILEYQYHIKRKASSFIRRYNGPKKMGPNEENTLSNVGWSQNDIEQELLLETWKLLVKYDPAKAYGPHGYCKKENFILDCLDNKLKMLNKRIWAKKRGNDCPHDSDSLVISGEFSGDE